MSRPSRWTIIELTTKDGIARHDIGQGHGVPREEVVLHIGDVYQVRPWNPAKKTKALPHVSYRLEGIRQFHSVLKAGLRPVEDTGQITPLLYVDAQDLTNVSA